MSEKGPDAPPVPEPSGANRAVWSMPPGVNEEALKRLRHDLRTPLNQIIGYTEILVETAAEDGGLPTLLED